jgi:mono/diheme cytochrome c family protein
MRVLVLATLLGALSAQLPAQQPNSVDFKKDIQPLFDKNCIGCHKGASAPSGLHLDSAEGVMTGGNNGKVIIPGNAKDSPLVGRVAERSMPPDAPLTNEQIAIITAWVDQGAKSDFNPNAVTQKQPVISNYTATRQGAIISEYCITCHNQNLKNGGLALDALDPAHVEKHPETWELVVRKIRSGMMPAPQATKKPTPAVREELASLLEKELDRTVIATLPPPGLHRMNRVEYANAIHDLLAVDIDPAKYLPSDDSTRGFDNVAAALSLSPALLEGYTAAAGKISRMVMGDVSAATQTPYRVPEDTSQDYHIEGMPFGTRGGILVKHVFPADGEYALQVTPISKGNMGNTNPFGEIRNEKLEFLVDGERIKIFNWDTDRQRGDGTFNVKFQAKAGEHTVVVTFIATNYAPGNDLDEHFLRSTIETGGLPGFQFFPHVGKIRLDGPFNPTGAGDTEARRKIFVCKPAAAAQETTCAKQIVTALARKAYRRPITNQDTEVLLSFYQQGRNEGGDFDHGVEMALRRVLADPEFVFRKEMEPANVKPGQKYRISDLELASRLSFFLWSSIPDDELLNLAAQNKLHDSTVLEQQVKRMLADSRSNQLVSNFAGQWLNIRGLAAQEPVTALFPDFDDNLRQAMRTEIEMFVSSIMHEDRSVLDLINGNYTYVNERLAKHYGIPNVYGSYFRRVNLPADLDMRRGLLGKGTIMTVSSQPGRTSPVQRGKTVMQIFLGVSPPDPPPNVIVKLVSTGGDSRGASTPTMREQMQMHRENEPCHSCHQIMDPIGFALENFDAVGSWRTEDAGKPVDAAGQLVDGTKINGLKDLRDALARYSPQFVRVMTEKLVIYALGRGTEHYDMPLVRSIVRDAAKSDYKFSSLVLGVVKSEQFQMNQKLMTSTPENQQRASR